MADPNLQPDSTSSLSSYQTGTIAQRMGRKIASSVPPGALAGVENGGVPAERLQATSGGRPLLPPESEQQAQSPVAYTPQNIAQRMGQSIFKTLYPSGISEALPGMEPAARPGFDVQGYGHATASWARDRNGRGRSGRIYNPREAGGR